MVGRPLPHRTRWTPAAAVAAAFACVVGAWPAAAQGQGFSTVDTRSGPGWNLTPSFTFGEVRDGNVDLAGRGSPPTGDYVTSLGPGFDAAFVGRHTNFDIGYAGTYLMFRDFTQLNSFDQNGRVELRRDVSRRLSIYAHNDASITPTTDLTELNGLPFLRVGTRVDNFGGGARIALDKFTTLDAGYRFEWVGFDRSGAFANLLLGGHSHTAYATLDRKVSERLSIGADADARRTIIASRFDRLDIYEVRGTMSYQISKITSLGGGAGLARLTGMLPSERDTGPSWQIGFTRRGEHSALTVTYVGSFVPSYAINGTLRSQDVNLSVRVPMARNRVYWVGSAAYHRNDPVAQIQTALPLRSYWVDSTVGYAFYRWLHAEIFVGRSSQTSDLPGGRVDRTRFGVQMVTSLPLRFQ